MDARQQVNQRRDNKFGQHIGGGVHNKIIMKKRRCRPTRLRTKEAPSVMLQTLFLSCQDVFKGLGTVPKPSDAHQLRNILDRMKPEDVGLSSDLQFFSTKNILKVNPRVTYTTIYKCNNFSLCIFFLPENAVIPLHDHPEMTVFSKLLLGTMHIKSYDWVRPLNCDSSLDSTVSPRPCEYPRNENAARLARLRANSVIIAPCDTCVLYPTSGGNIHQFTAINPCAVLDVIGPPYSGEDGRDCTYYKDIPFSPFQYGLKCEVLRKGKEQHYGWLEEIEIPE